MIAGSGPVIADVIRGTQMAIVFVVRTPYQVPSGRFVKRFRDKTVLAWLQRIWSSKNDAATLLGGHFYGGFGHLLDARIEESLPMPRTNKEVLGLLKSHSYTRRAQTRSGNFQIETDDDEMYLCQYFFDSKFESANQNRIRFVTHKNWLPAKVDLIPKSRPATYIAARYPSQTADSIYWDFWKINGHRLNRIGNIGSRMKESHGYTDCQSLIHFFEDISPEKGWGNVIRQLAGDERFANKSTAFKCAKHICQLHQHDQEWNVSTGLVSVYCQLIVFDDLWAKTYPTMWRSLKRMRRGDMLFGKQPRITM